MGRSTLPLAEPLSLLAKLKRRRLNAFGTALRLICWTYITPVAQSHHSRPPSEILLAHLLTLAEQTSVTPQRGTMPLSSEQALPQQNVFDFVLAEQPFQRKSEYSPRGLPHIPDDRAILQDNSTGRSLTLSTLRQHSLSVADFLQHLDLQHSRHDLAPTPTCPQPYMKPVVMIQLPNCIEYGPLLLGTFAAGLTASLVSPALTSSELAWTISNCKPNIIFTTKTSIKSVHHALESQSSLAHQPKVILVDELATQDTAETVRRPSIFSSNPSTVLARTSPGDSTCQTAVILWSSGTSGRSKPVLLTHAAVIASVAAVWCGSPHFTPAEKWLGFTPFYHVFGLINILLLAPCCGATIYTMKAFNVSEFFTSVEKQKITFLQMAPPVAVILAKHPSAARHAFRSVKGAVCGGAPLGYDIIKQVHGRLGFRICLGYGLSEACSVCLQTGLSVEEMDAQAATVGKPMYSVSVKIASIEDVDRAMPAGEEGEILIKSPSLLTCYLNNADATAESLTHDGWFRSGDIGFLRTDGFLTITDRLKEMIKVKAFQVSPAELEGILSADADVADAGVIGVFNQASQSEFPRAYVVAANSVGQSDLTVLADRLKLLVEEKTASYKWLRGQIVFVEQLPRSPSGKILRRLLKGMKGSEVILYAERVHSEQAKL